MRGEFVEVRHHRLYYYAAGTRGQGDPIILIHGFPTTSHLWSDLVSLLPAGHRVVVPDLLGHGRSDLGDGASLTIAAHGERVLGLMDELQIQRACLIGHHAGAAIAAAAALAQPARVGHLALLHPLGADVALTGTFAVLRAFMPVCRMLPGLTARSVRHALLSWYADPDRARASVDQYLAAWTHGPRRRAMFRQVAALTPNDVLALTRRLHSLTMPVAIVSSDDDPAVPRVALDHVRRALPGAALDIIRDARHYSPEESPAQVADVVARLLRR